MARMRIRDIAEQAGVSPATVSRYLNNTPGQMTEQTRARIAAVIERTGYRPRTAARNLRRERSGLLGVIMADVQNPYSSAMLEQLSAQAAAAGCALMTAFSGGEASCELEAIERLVDAGVDGLVVNACGGNDEALVRLAARVPLVLLDREAEPGGVDVVTSNNGELMRGLVADLAAAGCTHLALLTERVDVSSPRRERARAFEQAVRAARVAGETVVLDEDEAARAAQLDGCMVRAAGGKLGLVAANGLVFLRLVEALAAFGPALPQGLRVATFDDYPWNHVLFGGVTTAAQDTEAIAAAVLERLELRRRRAATAVGEAARVEAVRIEVPGRILRRASTHC